LLLAPLLSFCRLRCFSLRQLSPSPILAFDIIDYFFFAAAIYFAARVFCLLLQILFA